jgi:predicted unusual protein kinase regulating ubiquinone biosynthesis (AarF/ABC1/UbiB family)
MYLSAVRLYHPAPWGWLYSYQAVLITLRLMEHAFTVAKYLFVKAPLLMIWTRLPGTRHRRPPFWKNLAEVLAPIESRPSLKLGGGQLGTDLADADNVGEVSGLMNSFMATVESPPRFRSLFGSVMRGLHTEQGPAFIKFGQIMSMREEVPPTIRKELSFLQDSLPPMGPDEVRKCLEKELGKPVEAVFEYVEWTPIAAASLAQVQKAKLKIEQEEVALKIRRPYLEGIVTLDTIIICDIMFGLMNLALPLLRSRKQTQLFTTSYRESLEQEIDLVLEARSQEHFRKLVMKHPIYQQANHVARVYSEYTTTKLIVMELVKNYHRLDRIMDELTPEQLLEFATTKIEGYSPDLPLQLVFSQIALCIEGFCHWGFQHGDWHLGNLYAKEPEHEGDSWKMFLCDFGMMMDFKEIERLSAIQAVLDLCYYAEGSIIIKCFMQDSEEEMPKRAREQLIRKMETTVKKYVSSPEEGDEKVIRVTIQANTPTTFVSAMMYAIAMGGLKMETTIYWLLLKNMGYTAIVGDTLSTNLNATPMMGGHPTKFLKDWVMAELNALDIADLRTYVPEKLQMIRYDDRKQILRALATGEEVVPKRKLWTSPGKDVRFGEKEKPALAPPTSKGSGGDGGGAVHMPDKAEVVSPYHKEFRL